MVLVSVNYSSNASFFKNKNEIKISNQRAKRPNPRCRSLTAGYLTIYFSDFTKGISRKTPFEYDSLSLLGLFLPYTENNFTRKLRHRFTAILSIIAQI